MTPTIVHEERAFSLLEVLVAITFSGILVGIAAFNFRALENPAADASQELLGFIKQTRARALASTRAYTISPASATQVVTTYGTSCTAAQTADPTLTLTLPNGATLDDTGWQICYGTRGLADASLNILLSDADEVRIVQIVLGGGVRVL